MANFGMIFAYALSYVVSLIVPWYHHMGSGLCSRVAETATVKPPCSSCLLRIHSRGEVCESKQLTVVTVVVGVGDPGVGHPIKRLLAGYLCTKVMRSTAKDMMSVLLLSLKYSLTASVFP